jgi:acyl-CoA synthetase (NDP forming)
LARARDGAIIMIHDFEDRDYYHVLKRLARYIAVTEKLSIFQKDASSDVEGAERIAEEYRYEPL